MNGLTKVLIVLQLVFALVCSVLLVLMVSKQENYKAAMDAANAKCYGLQAQATRALADNADFKAQADEAAKKASDRNTENLRLQANLTQSQATSDASIQELKIQLASAEAKNRQLTAASDTLTASNKLMYDELAKLRPMIDDLNRKYGQSNQSLSEVTNLLRSAENTIKRLQEQLAQSASNAGAAGGGAGAVAPLGSENQITTLVSGNAGNAGNAGASQVNGKINLVEIRAGRTYVELPLGSRDGLQVNTRMYVYRGTGYVGDAVIESVTPDQAIAVIVSTKPGETVKQGDLVATVGK
jgi:membrane-associated HD superfamily phosphohydrolase